MRGRAPTPDKEHGAHNWGLLRERPPPFLGQKQPIRLIYLVKMMTRLFYPRLPPQRQQQSQVLTHSARFSHNP